MISRRFILKVFRFMSKVEFEKYKNLLEKINSERVFSIQNKNDEFWLVEECDEYFFHELTKQDCLELSELFAEIAKLIKE